MIDRIAIAISILAIACSAATFYIQLVLIPS
jgi:hypothetical protein